MYSKNTLPSKRESLLRYRLNYTKMLIKKTLSMPLLKQSRL